jgi:hypothetical protein
MYNVTKYVNTNVFRDSLLNNNNNNYYYYICFAYYFLSPIAGIICFPTGLPL